MSTLTSAPQANTIVKTGYVGRGQDQPGSGSDALTIANQSLNKGGMRGVGLLAIVLAEAALKKESVDLAEDYYKVNERDYQFFVSTHQPAIQQTVSEAMSPTLNPTYEHDFYASAPAGMAKSAILDKQWFETRRRTHRHSVGLQRTVDYRFAVQRTHAIVGGWNLGRRYEMVWADEHNNRRFDRKLEAANIGIGVGNIVRQGMATASAGLASAYDNIGDTVATIGNGLAARGGYNDGRANTRQRYEGQE